MAFVCCAFAVARGENSTDEKFIIQRLTLRAITKQIESPQTAELQVRTKSLAGDGIDSEPIRFRGTDAYASTHAAARAEINDLIQATEYPN